MKTFNFRLVFIFIIGFSLVLSSCKNDEEDVNATYNDSDIKFNDSLIYGSVSDIDGNKYKTIQIGNQIWFAENLKTTKLNDGTPIPLAEKYDSWSHMTSPAYCWFRNDAKTNKNIYGALYNWHTVNTGKLAPKGWHVATDSEWAELTKYLGGESIAGSKLKENDTIHWKNSFEVATNESGFSAVPGGHRDADGGFFSYNKEGMWWCSTEWPDNNRSAFIRNIYSHANVIERMGYHKSGGLSVRCIKD